MYEVVIDKKRYTRLVVRNGEVSYGEVLTSDMNEVYSVYKEEITLSEILNAADKLLMLGGKFSIEDMEEHIMGTILLSVGEEDRNPRVKMDEGEERGWLISYVITIRKIEIVSFNEIVQV